jgi:hypothetical protein
MHGLFTNRAAAIELARPRALFDSEIPELAVLIKKGSLATFIGVPNLAARAAQGKTMVQYLDVTPALNAVDKYQMEFEREFQAYDQITQYSNVSRGFTNPYESATATERKTQFTLNRVSEPQEDMQRWCRDNIRLLIDLALGNFSDERLFEMVEPRLNPEQREYWPECLASLRSDWKMLVTVDIETSSTILIDEDTQKNLGLELINAIGQYIDRVSAAAGSSPEMLGLAAKAFEHAVMRFRGGRAFKDDMRQAVAAIMQRLQAQQQQPQQPGADVLKAQNDAQKLQLQAQELQIKGAAVQLEGMLAQSKMALEARKLGLDEGDQAFQQYIQKAELELKQVIESLGIREKFMEEERLSRQTKQPQTIIVPPEQTVVVQDLPHPPGSLIPADLPYPPNDVPYPPGF